MLGLDRTGLQRTMSWLLQQDVTPIPRDVDFMAAALESAHGCHAAEVAEFFSNAHALKGDAGRCWAWAGVAERVRQRERKRLVET
jgi:hypothetical protein